MLNKITLIGRLGQDPEVRSTSGGQTVANFSVATDYTYKNAAGEKVKDTTWHRLVLWGNLAEISQKFLQKGDLAYFEGRIQNRTYEDKTGQNRTVTEVVVNELKMLNTQGKAESAAPAPAKRTTAPKVRAAEAEDEVEF